MKYILEGLTEYAERHLTVEDLMTLENMVGTEVIETNERADVDGNNLMMMADGLHCHPHFLKLKKLNP